MELDIFLPKEQLAFEYQGEQHFHYVYHLRTPLQQKQKDEEKRGACREKEITLVEVPYWWDKETSSLVAAIHKERKDLIPHQIDGELVTLMQQNEIYSEEEDSPSKLEILVYF